MAVLSDIHPGGRLAPFGVTFVANVTDRRPALLGLRRGLESLPIMDRDAVELGLWVVWKKEETKEGK